MYNPNKDECFAASIAVTFYVIILKSLGEDEAANSLILSTLVGKIFGVLHLWQNEGCLMPLTRFNAQFCGIAGTSLTTGLILKLFNSTKLVDSSSLLNNVSEMFMASSIGTVTGNVLKRTASHVLSYFFGDPNYEVIPESRDNDVEAQQPTQYQTSNPNPR